jgi:hypothetical protein
LVVCTRGPAGVAAATRSWATKFLYWFTKKYAPPENKPTSIFAPRSTLLPVSGFTRMFGAMFPAVAGPA